MSQSQYRIDIHKLSRDERIALAEELWDSVDNMTDDIPVTELQKTLLNERMARYHASPDEGYTWDEIKQEME